MDSNHRRRSRRIYSPLHLAALQPSHKIWWTFRDSLFGIRRRWISRNGQPRRLLDLARPGRPEFGLQGSRNQRLQVPEVIYTSEKCNMVDLQGLEPRTDRL